MFAVVSRLLCVGWLDHLKEVRMVEKSERVMASLSVFAYSVFDVCSGAGASIVGEVLLA